MAKFFTFLLIVLFQGVCFSQKETARWCFGRYTGLNFNTTPLSVTQSSINTLEGCTSISDSNGNIQFYSDGTKVFDQTDNIMANGSGLLGNGPSMTNQAAIIVKVPASANQYILFTLDDAGGPNGLMYHTIDMNLAAGLGSVTTKNNILQSPSSERLASVLHCNKSDVWVLSHDLNTGTFRNYLVTATGVSTSAVVSTLTTSASSYTVGSMKVSPDGKKLIMCTTTATSLPTMGGFELYDFDNVSGTVSNRQVLYNTHGAYSCEFSSDGKKAYGTLNLAQTVPTSTSFGYLLQWDLCSGNQSQIAASQFTVPGQYLKLGLQLAMDGKIYIANNGQIYNSLSVINTPNQLGAACSLSEAAIAISTGTVIAGLPNFNSSFLRSKNYSGILFQPTIGPQCLSYDFTASACPSDLAEVVSAKWLFGDPGSLAANTSTLINPTHKFSVPGTYTITTIKNYNCFSDTIYSTILATGFFPSLAISGKTAICNGNSTTLTVTGADTYSWMPGPSAASISLSPTITSIYTVSGTFSTTGCSAKQTVTVNVSKCTGLSSLESDTRFKIYPNPAHQYLYVSGPINSSVTIFDVMGKLVFQAFLTEEKQYFDISECQRGCLTAIIKDESITSQFLLILY